VAQFTE